MQGELGPDFRKPRLGIRTILPYLKLTSGRLHNEPVTRHRSIFFQMVLGPYFCTMTFLTNWLLSGEGFFSQLFFLGWVIVNILGFLYFTFALYLSLKDNLPKNGVNKKCHGTFSVHIIVF